VRRRIFIPRSYKPSELQCERALCVTPDEAAGIISSSKAVLITGGLLLEREELVKYAVKLSKFMPVIATGASSKPLLENGVIPLTKVFTLHHIIQFVEDGGWKPLRRCDLLVFLGVQPYYLSRVLSSLRHFSKIKTLNIDELYQPNADYSLSAISMLINEKLCSGCGDCVAVCRTMSKGLAINVVGGKIYVKPELCVGCGMCAEFCSRGAIVFEKGDGLHSLMLEELVRCLEASAVYLSPENFKSSQTSL
jgi:acetyl-CoA decarbonylase/synthase complex subunit epsilon